MTGTKGEKMSGNEWWGRLGLSEPEGGKGQEVTEPAAANIPADEGGREQEITDPVEAGVTKIISYKKKI